MAMGLGYFDGIHIGHQQVIHETKKIAKEKGLKSAVMTFDPHPSVVLRKSIQHVEYITPLEDKITLISDLEIDYLFVVHFTNDFSQLLPQEFIDEFIIGLNVHHVIAGFDYTYGRLGKGTMETLKFHSRSQFDYTIVPELQMNGHKVSSTHIRSLIKEGKTEQLKPFLGRFYQTSGEVIHGDKRGRTLGFPTANIDTVKEYLFPPLGVYAVRIFIDGNWHNGVCNIGKKPTFYDATKRKPSVEVHIFDFNREIYGQYVKIEWHIRIRSEVKFAGIQELISQIEKDKQNALVYFKK